MNESPTLLQIRARFAHLEYRDGSPGRYALGSDLLENIRKGYQRVIPLLYLCT